MIGENTNIGRPTRQPFEPFEPLELIEPFEPLVLTNIFLLMISENTNIGRQRFFDKSEKQNVNEEKSQKLIFALVLIFTLTF
jgi:hypothetical protein